ncbi:hypothetical protein GCM10011511_32480 [Puia dinghuensis]|uniref:Uncharacterized protein n=1 Tax=Puia dinghuensis TaxID=1792502 RepID=A0A8J2UER4_9BACT|nr:hypothetical protein GCM10011511_32480 [Puia dinghuensis]
MGPLPSEVRFPIQYLEQRYNAAERAGYDLFCRRSRSHWHYQCRVQPTGCGRDQVVLLKKIEERNRTLESLEQRISRLEKPAR